MRLKKGSKVEVQNLKEGPSGSWCCAEIVSGNGHTYNVKYGKSPPDIGVAMERVSRKVIRPCPPPVQGPRRWAPHDIAEFFENNSWKLAEVLRMVGDTYYFIKLLGSSREFKVHLSDLRVRQSWEGNRWIVIGKDSRHCDNEIPSKSGSCLKFNFKVPRISVKMQYRAYDKYLLTEPNVVLKEPHKVSFRGKKRRLQFCSPTDEIFAGATMKLSETQKVVRRKQQSAGKLPQSAEKVDAVAYPPNKLGEKYLHASLNYRTTGFPETMERRELSVDIRCTQSSTCSVGSSSGSNSIYNSCPVTGPSLDVDRHPDDSESICGDEHGQELSILSKVDLEETIHEYELNFYLSTLEALYASGPISWEQEALLSDLRLYHHISNDEYMAMLKRLRLLSRDT